MNREKEEISFVFHPSICVLARLKTLWFDSNILEYLLSQIAQTGNCIAFSYQHFQNFIQHYPRGDHKL